MDIPEFDSKDELIDFLVTNKSTLVAQKKAVMKEADALSILYYDSKEETFKANKPFTPENDEIKVKVVINTTNIMDSHDDVHIKGLWGKSLKQNKMIMHLQEHKMSFDKIISDGKDLKAFVKVIPWTELGLKFEGDTQALIFDSTIKRGRNEFMFDQYAKGFVKNHSVGMSYIRIDLAVNNEGYDKEFEIWEKYIDSIANKELAEDKGYFWAVREARIIEGSAVPIGSNTATPTLDNNLKNQPLNSIDDEQPNGTHKGINYKYLIENLK